MKNINIIDTVKEVINNLFKETEEVRTTDRSPAIRSVVETEEKELVQEKEQNSLGTSFDQWWKDENAKHFRNGCRPYFSLIFREPGDFDLAFGKVLDEFWHTYGNIRIRKEFPEIHMIFLTVEVYRLRDTWNRRDINLKQALLMDLRRAFVEFARSRGFQFDPWFPFVVSDIWKNMNTLIIELPCSPFPFTYPQLVPVLAPEEYRWLKVRLAAKSEL